MSGQQFDCRTCEGVGQRKVASDLDGKWVWRDCLRCKGTGRVHEAADGAIQPGPVGFAPDKVLAKPSQEV